METGKLQQAVQSAGRVQKTGDISLVDTIGANGCPPVSGNNDVSFTVSFYRVRGRKWMVLSV